VLWFTLEGARKRWPAHSACCSTVCSPHEASGSLHITRQ